MNNYLIWWFLFLAFCLFDSVFSVEIIKSQNDDQTYKFLILPNKLKVLVVHQPVSEFSSAAMNVNVGSWSNPPDLKGLAHFLEHMLFMGTKKFPDENGYSEYLAQHGGSSNAYTSSENTNYYFHISSEYFPGALDQFSQFFISPLFARSAVEREINAVNSEHRKNIQDDNWRLYEMMKQTANPNHPYHEFSTGSFETLVEIPKEKNISVINALLQFHQDHYSANQMGLALVGPQSIKTLEEWATQYFSEVPNNNVVRPSWETKPLAPQFLQKTVTLVPVKTKHQLLLQFSIPEVRSKNSYKPSSYIAYLLGHEGRGSLLSNLRELGWASGVSVYLEDDTPTWASLVVDVALVEKGIANTDSIISLIFEFISLIKIQGVAQWRYDEKKSLSEIAFNWREKEEISSFASSLAKYLGERPVEHILDYNVYFQSWNATVEQGIRDLLNLLVPKNMRTFIISPNFKGKTDLVEHFYGVEYSIYDYTPEEKKSWETKAPVQVEFSLPQPNNYIATDFSLKKSLRCAGVPTRIDSNTTALSFWFLGDSIFKIPKSNILIALRNPLIASDPTNFLNAKMLVMLVSDFASSFSYDAMLAGNSLRIDLQSNAIVVSVSGFSQKQTKIIKDMLELLSQKQDIMKFSQTKFQLSYHELEEALANKKFEKPYQRAQSFLYEAIQTPYWSDAQIASALGDVTLQSVQQFLSDFNKDVSFEVFGHGNLDTNDFNDLELTIKTLFSPQDGYPSPPNRIVQLPTNTSLNYIKKNITGILQSLRWLTIKEDSNSAIISYFQIGIDNVQNNAILSVVSQMTHEMAFNQLRTIEQLGYIVIAGMARAEGVAGFLILVQSEREVAYLDTRIQSFVVNNLAEGLCVMTQDSLDSYVSGVLSELKKKPDSLDDLTARYWPEIIKQRYQFEYIPSLIQRLQKGITLTDFINFCDYYIINPQTRRHLNIMVTGKNSVASETLNSIKDIYSFKTNSFLFPTNTIQNISEPWQRETILCARSVPSHTAPTPRFNSSSILLACGTGVVGLIVGMGVLVCYQRIREARSFTFGERKNSVDMEPFVDMNGKRGHYDVSSDDY